MKIKKTINTPSDTSNDTLNNTSDNTYEVSADNVSSKSSDASKTVEGTNTSLILALVAMFVCLNIIYLIDAKKNNNRHFVKK